MSFRISPTPRRAASPFVAEGRPLRKPHRSFRNFTIAFFLAFLAATAEAGVFRPKQVGTYRGNGIVTAEIAGSPISPIRAGAVIRVRANSLTFDGYRFRLSRGQVRARSSEFGMAMVLDGTYRRTGNRLNARGTLEVTPAGTSDTVDGSWVLRLLVDGRRARYAIGIRMPDPENPGRYAGIINGRASATRSR